MTALEVAVLELEHVDFFHLSGNDNRVLLISKLLTKRTTSKDDILLNRNRKAMVRGADH
jgi:hypothetical protein